MFSDITVIFLRHDPDEPLYKNSRILDTEWVKVCLKFNSNQEYSAWYFMPYGSHLWRTRIILFFFKILFLYPTERERNHK